MNNVVIESLEKFITKDLVKNLIYMVNDKYVLFDQYTIEKIKDGYTVYRYRDDRVFQFNKSRNATAWIILDKFNKFYEANRVLELDLKLSSVLVDKHIHSKMAKKSNLESYLLYMAKLQNDNMRQKKFQNELDKYITMAIICQQRGFENELTRTSRAQKD